MRTKFYTLMVLGIALVAALGWAGWGQIVLQADRVYATPAIAVALIVGLIYGWLGNWRKANWIANKLPVLGLIGTVAGMLLAFHNNPHLNADSAVEIGKSLVANFVAIAGYAWLSLVVQVCGGENEEV